MWLNENLTPNSHRRLIAAVLAVSFAAPPLRSHAANQEVVFRAGDNATLDWFVIDNPFIHGTLKVISPPPYTGKPSFNAAAVDIARNRLIFDTDIAAAHGYA